MRIFKFWALAALAVVLLLSGIGAEWLMAGGEPGTLTAWEVPTADPGLEGIAVAPSGEVYFTEFSTDRIGRLNPGANIITEWPAGDGPRYLALGDSGELFFTERFGNRISRLIPSGDFYSSETIPTGGAEPTGIIRTTDGGVRLWFAERAANRLGMLELGGFVFDVVSPMPPAAQPVPPATISLSPTTNVVAPQFTPGNPALPPAIAMAPETHSGPFTEWELMMGGSGHPRMLDIAPDGSIWISTETGSLLRFNAGSVMFYDLPSGSVSLDVAIDPAGNVWFTESWADKIGRLDPSSGDVTEWPLPHGGQPFALALAPDGSIWFSERDGDRIGHLEPWSNTITEYQLGANTHPLDIAIDGGDIWFVLERQGFVGRLSIGPVLGPPPGPPSGLPSVEINVDRGCGPGGRPYNLGDPIVISYQVEEAAVAILYDFDPYIGSYGRILTRQLGKILPGIEHRLIERISAVRGVETLVLRAATKSGRVLQDACSFSIAGVSPELARVWTDRGCGAEAVYHHRDRATIYYSVDVPVTRVRIFAINPTMGLVELTTTPLTGQSGQLELTVGPQVGDAVVVVAAVTPTHGVITSSCWVLME